MMVKSVPVGSIIEAIGDAGALWSDASFAPRRRARDAVVERTGYAPPVVEHAFDRLFGSLDRAAIAAVIADELGSIEVLDRFVERTGRGAVRAAPIGNVCVISSRTTIGVAVLPAVFALCAKCDVLVKDREDHLVAAFFATLGNALVELRDAARAQAWQGDGDAVDLHLFDAVVAFGSDETLRAIAAKMRFPARFIAHPAKASAGYISRESLGTKTAAQTLAHAAARDIVLYEGEGCLSLHALFVERGAAVAPDEFCELLRGAIEEATVEFPTMRPGESTAARRAMARDLATFRSTGAAGVFCDAQSSHLVLLDPPLEEPPLFLPRAIGVHSVEQPSEAAAYFARHCIAVEALAVTGPGATFHEVARRMRAARITRFGALQAPPLGSFHGGRPRIAEFVRWIGDEA